jgi:hypothetical protein
VRPYLKNNLKQKGLEVWLKCTVLKSQSSNPGYCQGKKKSPNSGIMLIHYLNKNRKNVLKVSRSGKNKEE